MEEAAAIYCIFLFDFFLNRKRRRFCLKQSDRRFTKPPVRRFLSVSTGSIAYPVQKSDQTDNPPVPGPTGRFGPVFKTLNLMYN
jgi:hypothetical protein